MAGQNQPPSESDKFQEPLLRSAAKSGIYISLIPLVTVFVLFSLKVPFGVPDLQFYRWSPLASLRLQNALYPIIGIALVAIVLRRKADLAASSNRIVFTFTMTLVVLLGIWTHIAPPAAANQHFLNLLSPSHEGAFMTEAAGANSLGDYLQHFPDRLTLEPKDLRGTRVLSNPPGITMLAVAIDRIIESIHGLPDWILDIHHFDVDHGSFEAAAFTRATCMAWMLTLIWILSAPFMYMTYRIWLAPLPAAALTVICFFTPSSICFAPGKDPAQLLTVSVMMWGWLSGYQNARRLNAFLGGLALVIGLMSGLMHVWIAMVLVVGTAWSARGDKAKFGRLLYACLIPSLTGMAVGITGAWLLWGWNLVGTLIAVGHSYFRIQEWIGDLPWYWDVAKAPAFALFAGAGLWGLAPRLIHRRPRDSETSLGNSLLILSMLAIAYGCINTTFETPRLLVSFIPILGLAVGLSGLDWPEPSRTECRFLVSLTAVHVIATVLQWSLFDVRESEMRIITGRYLN